VYEEELKLRLTPIDIPLSSVNKINDATSLRRQSPSGAKPNFNKRTLIGRQIRWYHH
jgi:hypothetical protein